MREIKFRAKIKNLHADKWVYGYLVSETYINEKNILGYTPVRKETVGQYTGLKDKNGKEIYEGDIVQYIYYKYSNDDFGHKGFYKRLLEIYYDETNMKFDYKFIKSEEIEMPKDYKEPYMEVIGNIFENGDLLNDSK